MPPKSLAKMTGRTTVGVKNEGKKITYLREQVPFYKTS